MTIERPIKLKHAVEKKKSSRNCEAKDEVEEKSKP